MMPPLIRRCPECGHVTWSYRFAVVDDEGRTVVECPECGHRFERIERPWLQ